MPSSEERNALDSKIVNFSSLAPPESPKFQLANLLTSPRSSIGGPSTEKGGASVRKSAGGWRSQWAPTSSKTASSAGSADGRISPKRGVEGSEGTGGAEGMSRGESATSSINPIQDALPLWEQGITPKVMTPPGAINELPSYNIGSPAAQPRVGESPWSIAGRKSGEYDWANFVYAYARGRWDPVRLPQPPSQSNIVPGAVTQIGTQTESYSRPATPEDDEEVITIRRPSLTYSIPNEGLTTEGTTSTVAEVDPFRLAHARTPPPVFNPPENLSTLDARVRANSTIVGSAIEPLPSIPADRSAPEPAFIDPFNVLQIASNSTPNMRKVLTLGQTAEKMMEDPTRSSPSHGAKTDSEVVTRANLSRHGSDQSQPHNDRIWQSPLESNSPSDRHAGVLPFVSPKAMAAASQQRPPLAAHMSEMVLSHRKTSWKEDHLTFAALNDHNNEQDLKASLHRPRPTPVQHPALSSNGEDSEEMRLATWASAPEMSVSSGGAGVSSYGNGSSHDDVGTIAGLRRAARRTSVKRSEGSQDISKGDLLLQTSLGKNFPTASTNNDSLIRAAPTLDRSRSGSTGQQISSSTVTQLPTDGGGKGKKDSIKAAEERKGGAIGARSRTTSESGIPKLPSTLSEIGQSVSNPNLTSYLNVGKSVEHFYRDHGYLPAIIPPNELNRRQALRRYGPPKMTGDMNFDRIAHLVKLVFNTKLVLISLVGEKSQFFQSEVGASASGFSSDWLQERAQSRDCSICAHAILQQNDEALVVLDAEKDWRFAGNPLVTGPPHIRFYAGSPLRTADGYNLGSLCIIDDHPWTEFSPRQRHTLKEFSRVVMREMELSRDSIHLRIRDRMQHSIEKFTRECLEMESSEVDEKEDESSGLHKVYDFAAKGMREALNASGAIVFDLSHFELVVSQPQSQDEDGGSKIFFPSPYQYPEITPFANFEHPETVQGINSTDDSSISVQKDVPLEEKTVPPMAVLGSDEAYPAPEDRDRPVPLSHYLKVAEFLKKYRTGHYFPFTPAPFRHLLPADMSNILLVPIFGLNKQPFALLCAYSKPTGEGTTFEDIEEPGLQYLRAMGTIILSAILKKDIMLADKAKSHFISNISHELRTPLHGILAAAELLTETKLSATQGSYLETVEACGKSLLELVNHVLDFTKLSGNMRANQPHAKPSQRCDLVKLVQEVCESSWIGQMAKKLESQQNSGIGSAYAKGSDTSSPLDASVESTIQAKQKILAEASNVETVIDISFRSSGWLVKCDAGGIRRVLMNLIGNSLKFTTAGFVHVSVREVQSTESHVVVELAVTDTGKGISRTFLEEQLFHPFTQENHLGPGTGLGLSIVNSIVQSPAINGKIDVWSTVGQGTEIRVTCELELSSVNEAEGMVYQPVLNVQGKHSISLIGFQENLRGQSDLKDVFRVYFEDWWKFKIANGTMGDLILVNDDVKYLTEIGKERKQAGKPLPPIIVLTGARGDAKVAGACEEYQKLGGVARLLFKPAGPAKLEAITDFCLQCFERGKAGKPMVIPESDHDTPLPSPGLDHDGKSSEYFDSSAKNDQQQNNTAFEDALTPKAHPLTDSTPNARVSRPFLTHDLRRDSHHISPGPPTPADAACVLRRHSSEDRVVRTSRGPDSPQSVGESRPVQNRPMMPTRSITYHEPRLQRHVLMSPLRSPHNSRKAEEASDYFGSLPSNGTSSTLVGHSSSSGPDSSSPNSPGSVISLEGGEGAVLKTALHNAGLLSRGNIGKKRLQILTVEDNHINRKVLAAYFGKLDVDFVEATNGEEGVKVFESYPANHFDVIFMDLSMPVLDGVGAMIQIRGIEAERFRKDRSSHNLAWRNATQSSNVLSTPGGSRPSAQARAKIFTLSGRSSDEDKRKAFSTGADAYLVKPLSFKVLSSLLNKISAF